MVTLAAGGVLSTERGQRLTDVVVRVQDTTAEIRVRAAVVLLVAFVALAERFGLETILGGDPAALLITPLFVLALLVVRGVPALLLRHELTRRETAAAGLLQATSLPFLVTTAMIGVDTGLLSGVTAASLVAAGIVSVLVFPATALTLLRPRGRDTVSPGPRVLPA